MKNFLAETDFKLENLSDELDKIRRPKSSPRHSARGLRPGLTASTRGAFFPVT